MSLAYVFFTVCLGVLTLNLLVLAGGTAAKRSGAGHAINPEDKKLNKEAVVPEQDIEVVARWRRAHGNALENIPLFLIVALAYMATGPYWFVAAPFFGVYTLARILHSVAYVNGLQPWRTIGFAVGALTTVALAFTTFVNALLNFIGFTLPF